MSRSATFANSAAPLPCRCWAVSSPPSMAPSGAPCWQRRITRTSAPRSGTSRSASRIWRRSCNRNNDGGSYGAKRTQIVLRFSRMTRTVESILRFVNLTTSGLLAGSLGFGEAALMPGWEKEHPKRPSRRRTDLAIKKYFNAIGPVALGTAVTLAVGSRGVRPMKRVLDTAAAIGLAGVLAATLMATVPINKELEAQPPGDYPSDRSQTLARNWSRAHAVRTTLGIGAVLCAVASNLSKRPARRSNP